MQLGLFSLKGFPPKPAGSLEIQVVFEVDKTCAVTVSAVVKGTQLQRKERFEALSNMSDPAIEHILLSAEASRSEDDLAVQRIESVNRANALIRRAEGRLKVKPDDGLSKAVALLGLAIQSGRGEEIRIKADTLASLLKSPPTDFDNLFSGFMDAFGPQSGSAKRPVTSAIHKPVATARSRGQKSVSPSLVAAPSTEPLGKVFGGGKFTLDPRLCFVLMPFAEDLKPVYEDHLKPVIEKAGLSCQRADELSGPTLITWDIWERINRARFLVADLTGQNANVFYELGLAHALSKDVILLTQSMDFVPFDLKVHRCIVYEFTPRGMGLFETKLHETINSLMKNYGDGGI